MDKAFLAEDVHLLASASVDGCVFIWKINEGPNVEDKPQILGTASLALKIIVEGESVHPLVCWHPHKQLVGKHDGEVTDLSMCQWMTTRLASASTDGTVHQNLMIHLVINKNMDLLEGIQRVSALQFWMRLPLVYINIEK